MITIQLIETINFIVAVLGLSTFLAGSVLIVDLFTSQSLKPIIHRFGLWVSLCVTVFASLIAFTYSDVFGFIPCGLCWIQRVFLFSQPFLLGTALYIKDGMMPRYGITLSVAGLVIGLYQHYLQMGGKEFVACPVAGAGADCTEQIMLEFGFITYPLLASMLFAFLVTLYYYIIKAKSA